MRHSWKMEFFYEINQERMNILKKMRHKVKVTIIFKDDSQTLKSFEAISKICF